MPMLALRLVSPATIAVVAGLAAMAQAGAQTAEDPKSRIVTLYTLSIAIDICGGLDLSGSDEDKLEAAISTVEGQLALTEEASEDLYSRLSAAADNDKDVFCKGVVPTLKDTIEKLPD